MTNPAIGIQFTCTENGGDKVLILVCEHFSVCCLAFLDVMTFIRDGTGAAFVNYMHLQLFCALPGIGECQDLLGRCLVMQLL